MKSNAIFTVKAVAILGVVLHHIGNRRYDSATLESIAILPNIFSWAVLAFIGVSGWLHAMSEEKQEKTLFCFTKQRMNRLLLPYAVLVLAYAVIWQLLRVAGIEGIGSRLRTDLLGKIYQTVPLIDYEPVAVQLYFLPLLFLISIIAHAFIKWNRVHGPVILAVASLLLGVVVAPNSMNTGFSKGMLLFGMHCYSAGFLLYIYRENGRRFICVAASSAFLLYFLGIGGLPKAIPSLILASMSAIGTVNSRILNLVGESSGTIFAYHTPFILQPLVILSVKLPNRFHFPGAILASVLAILICTILHHKLKGTSGKAVLM